MEQIMPIVAVALVAAGELREWERYPTRERCKRQVELASKYCEWLWEGMRQGGNAGDLCWAQHASVAEVRAVWCLLLELAEEDNREKKLVIEEKIRQRMGDDRAFIVGEWPAVMPLSHFRPTRELPAVDTQPVKRAMK